MSMERDRAGAAPQADRAELFLRDVSVDGHRVDVRVRGATIAEVGPGLRPGRDAGAGAGADTVLIDGGGGALIPGLHDHHIHLLATAAARASVAVGPADARGAAGLARALRAADAALPPGRWVRAVGYHESVAGELDRDRLDRLLPRRPVRVQHRTGAMWVLNTAAIDALDLHDTDHPGAERDDGGRLTGRLHRSDAWLHSRLPPQEPPDLAAVGAELARYGITGVTDATPYDRLQDLDALARAAEGGAGGPGGALPQRVVVMGGLGLVDAAFPPGLTAGPVKLVVDDGDYPDPDELAAQIALAHRHDRPVAIHCVTRVALVLALAAWQTAGSRAGDRIEHGSVVPPELRAPIAELGLTVVTQPAFVAERGDQYLTDVDPDDVPHLYPCRSLADAGIEVAASSDAPHTAVDPWAAMRAAVTRRTAAGAVLGPDEAVDPPRALALYLGDPQRPGGPSRRVRAGARADLCLLAGPVPHRVDQLSAGEVVGTLIAGRLIG
jgi:predicted amidohydrolase YtcJ